MNITKTKTAIQNENLFNLDKFENVVNYSITDNDHNKTYEIDFAKSKEYENYYHIVLNGYHWEQYFDDISGLINTITLTEWNKIVGASPATVLSLAKLDKIALFAELSQEYREKLLPEYKLLNASLGVYDAETTTNIKNCVVAFRTEFYRLQSLVNSKLKVSTIEAISHNYDKITL